MDKIGDWLYIVFIIIAGISGLISSGKKKKTPTEVLGQPNYDQPKRQPANNNPWDTVRKEPPPLSKNKKKRKQETSPFLAGETSSFAATYMVETINQLDPEPEYTPEITIENPDDLRKAIIYSEILNRKY